MTTRKSVRNIFLIVTASIVLNSCESELSDDPIPFKPFTDVVLNLNLPENQELNTKGSIDLGLRFPSAGVRGIILHKKSSTSYLAFEKNCSFQPADAGATVEIHSSTLFMHDVTCGSSFNFEGKPTESPAWRPLRQYKTLLSGNTLTITDEIVE